MAITLKNITAADTISSMVDKINFNFDQLLLNGGGIEGPRGIEGYPGMQGIQGEKGNTGLRGERGERGVHFHILPLGDDQTDPSVIYGTIHGLDETDPEGDEYQDGDMIIALIPVSSNGDANYTDSIWRVEERPDNFYPVNTNIIFSQTTFFEELIVGQSNNTLLRTKFTDSNNQRGLVLNDYNHRIIDGSGSEPATITDSMIDDIVDNNIVLVYTEALSQANSEGSPNCGIVFYKNGETSSELGDFPRINYVVSPNAAIDHINYFNVIAPEQGLHLVAKDKIFINSIEGDIAIKATDESSEISVEHGSNKVIISKKDNNIKQLHLIGDEIFIEKENISSEQWLKIRNKNYSDSDSCEIVLCKQNTYITSNSLFSIGQQDLENLDVAANENDYYGQSRITIINSGTNKIDIISPEINVGRIPEGSGSGYDASYDINSFGLSVTKNNIKVFSHSEQLNSFADIAKIELNANELYKTKVISKTTYPGVTQISNVSEKYLESLINYTDDSFDISSTGYKLFAAPMGDAIGKSGRYNYANINCYQNMSIRNINNMGAVHAGSIVFNGRYGTSDTVYDKLVYDFIRVGNVVHCTFHGIINTNKICARVVSGTPSVSNNPLTTYGESYFKSSNHLLVNWPTSNSISSKLPTYMSVKQPTTLQTGNSNLQIALSGSTSYKKSAIIDYAFPRLSAVSLNKLYLNLYPPIIKVTYDTNTNKFKTNVTDFNGHLTYSAGGNIYEKELTYTDNITTPYTTDTSLKKIPAITISDMKNSSTAKIIVGANTSSVFTLSGSSTANTLVEINGYFSYVLHCNSEDMHSNIDGIIIGTEAVIDDASGNIRYTSGNSVNVEPIIIDEYIPPVNQNSEGTGSEYSYEHVNSVND